MTRRSRRAQSPAFKAKVALAAIKGGKKLAELTQQLDVHPDQITHTKIPLPKGAAGVFGQQKSKPKEVAVDLKGLHAMIGALMLEDDFLSGSLTKPGYLSTKR